MSSGEMKIFNQTADTFDLPTDYAAGLAKTEIIGNRKIVIENQKGILEYSQDEISILAVGMNIRIEGSRLELKAMNETSLIITGEIRDVKFIR